jgi:phosphatidylserine decarboxylase
MDVMPMDDGIIQQEINKYKKFKKVDGATYRKVNIFLRKRTYITAREWALARLCTDFRTSGGAEMTFIGKHLPELVPFMDDTYTPQAVNQARNSFKKKVRKAGATFFYGAMCGFFTTDELDDLLFEASEVARFLLEVEGTTLDIDDEIDIEDRITTVMRSVGEAAKTILKTRSEENEAITPSGESILNSPDVSGLSEKLEENNLTSTPIITENPRLPSIDARWECNPIDKGESDSIRSNEEGTDQQNNNSDQ